MEKYLIFSCAVALILGLSIISDQKGAEVDNTKMQSIPSIATKLMDNCIKNQLKYKFSADSCTLYINGRYIGSPTHS